jgi:hypothetical protein
MPRAKKALTLDEQIVAFLDQWEATRTAQARKYELRADRWKRDATMKICFDFDRRRQRHYEHELKMLQELRRRAFTIVVRARTLQAQVTPQESET